MGTQIHACVHEKNLTAHPILVEFLLVSKKHIPLVVTIHIT
jgi:hypothetical protein